MNATTATILLALIGIVGNWLIAGGGWKSAFPAIKDNFPKIYRFLQLYRLESTGSEGYKDLPAEDWVNGALYAACCAVFSALWWPVCVIQGVMMATGRLPALGPYMGAIMRQRETVAWGVKMMTMRGAQWGALLALGMLGSFVLGQILAALGVVTPLACLPPYEVCLYALAVIVGCSLQGVIALVAIRIGEHIPYNRVLNGWTLHEIFEAPFAWLPILIFFKVACL